MRSRDHLTFIVNRRKLVLCGVFATEKPNSFNSLGSCYYATLLSFCRMGTSDCSCHPKKAEDDAEKLHLAQEAEKKKQEEDNESLHLAQEAAQKKQISCDNKT